MKKRQTAVSGLQKHAFHFTLIELLVVIAIIAILAAMLLPALGKARDRAKQIHCMGNHKQLNTAVAFYTDTYKGYLPVACDKNDKSSNWKLELCPFLGVTAKTTDSAVLGSGVFFCTSSVPTPELSDAWKGGLGWNREYMGYSDYAGLLRQTLSSLKRPSETILFGDTTDWYKSGVWELGYLWPASCSWGGPKPSVGNRHTLGVNVAMADGHCAWMKQSLLRSGKNNDVNWFYRVSGGAGDK